MIPSCSLSVAFALSVYVVPMRLDIGDMDMYICMHLSRISTERYRHHSWWDKIALLSRKMDTHTNVLFCSSVLICFHSLFHLSSFTPIEFNQIGLLATISSEFKGQNGELIFLKVLFKN